VGRPLKRSLGVEGKDPRSLFGTCGVVEEGGWCNLQEVRTKRGGRKGQRVS
jgi:hypothetical protein